MHCKTGESESFCSQGKVREIKDFTGKSGKSQEILDQSRKKSRKIKSGKKILSTTKQHNGCERIYFTSQISTISVKPDINTEPLQQ